MELAHSNFQRVDAIFIRCLRTTMSIELWQYYLQYTRRVNPLPPLTGEDNSPREQTRHILEDAYDFALKHIGWHHESGVIWQDYLNLVREREARGSWQEGQKMDLLRKIFRRAVVIPINQVEAIWREYDAYENALNKVTAKKFLAEISPGYMQARAVLRDLKRITGNLARPKLPHLPGWIISPRHLSNQAKQQQNQDAWRSYLAWEESNPLMLEDAAARQARVLAAYREAIMYMRFDCIIWYNAATYCQSIHRENEVGAWLKAGIDACPWSLLLHFSYAEVCRAQGQYAEGTASLDALVAYLEQQLDQRTSQLHDAQAQVDMATNQERQQIQTRRQQFGNQGDDDNENAVELADAERRLHEDSERRKQQIADEAKEEMKPWKDIATQVWIKYMQFVRRVEGIRPSRQIFGRARRSKHAAWQVYEANALLEYHCSKEPTVATKVFELALRTFGSDEQLVVRYLNFLIQINDDTNARAVFERTVSSLPADKARVVWDRWVEYEACYGDTSGCTRLETRLQDLYPDEPKVLAAADRLRYETLDAVRRQDLGMMPAKPSTDHLVPVSSESMAGTRSREPTEPPQDTRQSSQPPATSNKGKNGGGRQTMEDIRKSLLSSSEGTKKDEKRATSKEPPTKKTKTASTENARRARTEPTPPPQPSLPEALLYFLSILPHAQVFDGPRIPPDSILECIMHTSLPIVPLAGYDRKTQGSRRAVWYKYPNPHAEHVQSIDVLDRTICEQTGVLRTERLVSMDQTTPRWIKKILGIDGATYAREVIMYDPQQPAISMDTVNLSFSEYLVVKEDVVYRPNGLDQTRFDQIAEFDCRGLSHNKNQAFGLVASAARKVEEASHARFEENAELGRSGFAYILAQLYGSLYQKDQAAYVPHIVSEQQQETST
ncbi:mRNA 3'-end-processing protein rna14 [Malassezia yamatoensis]|uniref:mRNA 3'-end-processing protein RNA14 n=1 Tax=Malassezia yamatoensis TaxID=253288 RepID=A0AAJ5YUZ0_9BASI|nr:mRNA 3'-end-processing protein rna14 [Malassezia yamatoensis]